MISVIIPVRNGETVIVLCLDSLFSQIERPDEIIVVDNGSTDETALFVKQWALSHPEIPLRLLTEEKIGPSAARNRGASAVKGDILVFLDADCEAPSDWIQRIQKEISGGTDAGGGPYVAHGASLTIERYASLSWFSPSKSELCESPFSSRFLLGGNMALSRKAWESVKGFDESLRTAEDLEISFRIKAKGMALRSLPGLAVTHRVQSSLPKRLSRALRHGMVQAKIVKDHFGKLAVEPVGFLKCLGGIVLLGWLSPFLGGALFFLLGLLWEWKAMRRLAASGISVSMKDLLSVPCNWALSRLAMEAGRLIGSVRYGVFCW